MSISIDGSAKGGSDTSAGHHVGVGAVLLGVRRLGGPVVGGTWTVVEKVQSDENSVMSPNQTVGIEWHRVRIWTKERATPQLGYIVFIQEKNHAAK